MSLTGFGKPASKTADWIVDTYIPNSPISYRLSIENVIEKTMREILEPIKQELLAQPAPRTYEVARALATIETWMGQ